MNLILHRSNFDSLQIVRFLNRAHIVGNLAESIFPEGKALDPLDSEGVEEVSANGPIEDFIGMFTIPENEWKETESKASAMLRAIERAGVSS